MKSAEKAIVARSPDGVTTHDMGTGWHVIVAKCGERRATWHYHTNDDARIALALKREAERRFAMWEASKTPDPDYLREDREERRRLDREYRK